jgi:hypothetical protein
MYKYVVQYTHSGSVCLLHDVAPSRPPPEDFVAGMQEAPKPFYWTWPGARAKCAAEKKKKKKKKVTASLFSVCEHGYIAAIVERSLSCES